MTECIRCGAWFPAGLSDAAFCRVCLQESERGRNERTELARWAFGADVPAETPADQYLRVAGSPTLFGLDD